MENTAIFEMLLFGIVLPYTIFKMQQPNPKEVEKRKAVTAACTEELRATLGREPEQSEISRMVSDRYQAEYEAYWAEKTAAKAERKAAKAERKAERKAAKADAKANKEARAAMLREDAARWREYDAQKAAKEAAQAEYLRDSRAIRREWNKIFRQLGIKNHY